MFHRAWPLAIFLAASTAFAQFQIEDSHSTADLRGIDNVGAGVAWASGTDGTVLRTEDGGYLWQACSTPPGAEHLDFRGVQAFDANTAVVLSSGKGDQSRLYKTTDGCQSWKLVFTNPDKDGFWDAMMLDAHGSDGYILGDPVGGRFVVWKTTDKGGSWSRFARAGVEAAKGEGAFAASNSAFLLEKASATGFVTGGPGGARIFLMQEGGTFKSAKLPLKGDAASAGAFSINSHDRCCWIAVGGDYLKADERTGTAAYTLDGGKTWQPAQTPPHGYRSAVAYDSAAKTWITVGPNGTDVSTDDGRIWRALRPDPALHESPDADRNWNALSLPYVVGPHGRIGKLDPEALTAPKHP